MSDLSWFHADDVVAAPRAQPTFAWIFDVAGAAGAAAHHAAVPEPMTLVTRIDRAGHGRTYHCSEGMCGFSWVHIKGNTPFGAYCKKAGIARPAYGGGLNISYPFMSQSYDRGQAWASAFADSLKSNGIFAYADGRLD